MTVLDTTRPGGLPASDAPHPLRGLFSAPPRPPLGRLVRDAARLLLTPHPEDHYGRSLALPGFVAQGTGLVVGVDRATADWTVLTLHVPGSFRRPPAGGAVTVGVAVDGVIHRRSYSPVDAETRVDGGMAIAVRRHEGGFVSKYLWHHAEVGDTLLLDHCDGEMTLPDPRPEDVLLVSGGSGITPMLALASTLAAESHPGRVAWIHHVRDARDIPCRSILDRVARKARFTVRVVETGREGHLTSGRLDDLVPWHRDAEIFCCGPDSLADGLAGILGPERWSRVRRERFVTATPPVPETDGGTVTHTRSGIVAENTGTTLLDGAESAGLSPQHGCRRGICHTCVATCTSGTTRDLRTGVVDDRPGRSVQICVSAPVGDVEIDL